MNIKGRECLKVVLYTIVGILFIMASYSIIINLRHYRSLNEFVLVSEADIDYTNYKNNVILIEEKINNIANTGSNSYRLLNKVLLSMKKDGVFRLIPKDKLNYSDLYELNEYYMEELINNNWINDLKELNISKKYNNIMTLLINNSNYLDTIFTSNSLILYDSKLDNKIDNNYHFILNNYLSYSNVILDMCNELGG